MTRTSRLSTPGLLLRHGLAGSGASILVAVLVALSVLAVTAAPRALGALSTAELRHELGQASPALIDLTGGGRIGLIEGLPAGTDSETLLGSTDAAIDQIADGIPAPLGDHLGEPQWYTRSAAASGTLPDGVPLELKMYLAVDLDYESRIRFVDGAAPAAWSGNDRDDTASELRPPIEVAISQAAAETLGLGVGDVIADYLPAPVEISGVYEPLDPDEGYWVHASDLDHATIEPQTGQVTVARTSAYISPDSVAGLVPTLAVGQLAAWIPVIPDDFAYTDAAELATQARTLIATGTALPNFGELSFHSGLPDALERVVGRVTASSALLALCVSGLLGVLLAVFALGVQSVLARRRAALALAAARGAGALQLRGAMLLEGLALVLPGSLLAYAVVVLLMPEEVGVIGWALPAAVAAAPPLLFAIVTSPRSLRNPRTDLQVRSRSRVRGIAEIGLVALAVIALFLLARRGLVASADAVGIDPLLAATPLLLAAAVGVGVLRLYPIPLLAVQRALRRRTGAAGLLGAARAVRDPALGFAAALALVVGISIVVFSTVMASTVRAALDDAVHETVGADVRVTAPAIDDDTLARLRALDGVRAVAAPSYLGDVPFVRDADDGVASIVLVDTGDLRAVGIDVPDGLDTKVGGRIPVLASSDWAPRVGDGVIQLGEPGVDATRVGAVDSDAVPGAGVRWLLVDAAFADELGLESDAERAFVDVDDGASVTSTAAAIGELVADALPSSAREQVQVTDAQTELAELRSSPVVASLDGVLLIAAAVSLLLTMLTVVLASVAAAATRTRTVGMLRVLGVSPRQLRVLLAWELGPVAVTAVVVGSALGIALSFIVNAALDLRAFVGGRTQPDVVVDPVAVLVAVAAFVVVVVIAGLLAVVIGRRVAPAATLKMGEA